MYNRLEINEGVYVPRDPETFPKDDAQAHLVEVKAPRKGARQFVFDETYPYLDRSFGYWLNRNVIGIPFLWTVIYLRNLLHFGLKIEGREKIRQNRQHHKTIIPKGPSMACSLSMRTATKCISRKVICSIKLPRAFGDLLKTNGIM